MRSLARLHDTSVHSVHFANFINLTNLDLICYTYISYFGNLLFQILFWHHEKISASLCRFAKLPSTSKQLFCQVISWFTFASKLWSDVRTSRQFFRTHVNSALNSRTSVFEFLENKSPLDSTEFLSLAWLKGPLVLLC